VGSNEGSAQSDSSGTRVWQSDASAAATATGAEKRVRARERRKEEESDFASLMGHNGDGIRVTGRLEVAHAAGGH
jgi:PAB1-binding protein PBP1